MSSRAVAFCLLPLVGCGLASPITTQPAGECMFSADCGTGQACIETICVDVEPNRLGSISAELTPPPNAGAFAKTQVREIVPGPIDFELPAAAVFENTVVLDADTEAPVPATVTVFGEDRIPRRTADARLTLSGEAPVELRLRPGRYTARVLPLEDGRPGMEIDDWTIAQARIAPIKEFRLAVGRRQLEGVVSLRTQKNVRLEGVTVRAVAMPSRLASTTAVTGPDGAYLLDLPSTEDTAFVVTAVPSSSSMPAWSFVETVNVPEDEARVFDIGLEETADANVGRLELEVLGVGSEDEPPVPIANAELTLTATTTLATRSFSIRGTTDNEGLLVVDNAPVEVLAARYIVQIEPPPTSDFARTSTTIDLRRATPGRIEDKQIALAPRTVVHGQFSSALGRDLIGTALLFDPADESQRPVQAITGADGRYEVSLDPGDYLVRVEGGATGPNMADGAPTTYTPLTVDAAQRRQRFDHSVPAGRLVSGFVTGPDGARIANVDIDFFLELGERAYPLGRATTDENGRYEQLISDIELVQ